MIYCIEKDQCTQSPTAESVYTARFDYHGMWSWHLSFSEGEQLEIYEKWNSFEWKGRSLLSSDEGDIPSSTYAQREREREREGEREREREREGGRERERNG